MEQDQIYDLIAELVNEAIERGGISQSRIKGVASEIHSEFYELECKIDNIKDAFESAQWQLNKIEKELD